MHRSVSADSFLLKIGHKNDIIKIIRRSIILEKEDSSSAETNKTTNKYLFDVEAVF
jgi:hypothetical protein